jgi:hypothetical protein
MSRTPANSERTPALHSQQTYDTRSQYEHEYLSSDLVQGMLSQIVAESDEVTRGLIDEIIDTLDQTDGSVSREHILMEHSEQREVTSRALDRLRYYCLTLESAKGDETIVGLHPNGKQAARRGYEADRTRKAVLD